MKKNLFFTLFTFFLLSTSLISQDLTVFKFIGKQKNDLIQKFGNPAHIDNSVPSMICIFYRNPNMVFVSDESGIYQADIQREYSSKAIMLQDLTNCIQKSINSGYKVDTLSADTFLISNPGVRARVNIDNIGSGKYHLKIEAKRHE